MTSHERPEGVSDETVEAVGTVAKAYEHLIRARGHLYAWHQQVGEVNRQLQMAVDDLDGAGHPEEAARIRDELVGRNALSGRWTFQTVVEFDETYYGPVEAAERRIRHGLIEGRPHVRESEMKDDQRTPGEPGHQRRP